MNIIKGLVSISLSLATKKKSRSNGSLKMGGQKLLKGIEPAAGQYGQIELPFKKRCKRRKYVIKI